MATATGEGRVHHERHARILKIIIDNPAKKNAFSPEMMEQLSEAFTLLDRDADLWAGVLCAEGKDFTAGLDMPKFFGRTPAASHDRKAISIRSPWPITAASR
jgi:enoyl-CoA hydratase